MLKHATRTAGRSCGAPAVLARRRRDRHRGARHRLRSRACANFAAQLARRSLDPRYSWQRPGRDRQARAGARRLHAARATVHVSSLRTGAVGPARRPVSASQLTTWRLGAVSIGSQDRRDGSCGDAWERGIAGAMKRGRYLLLVADGLGHGLDASRAATAAVEGGGRAHPDDAAPLRVRDSAAFPWQAACASCAARRLAVAVFMQARRPASAGEVAISRASATSPARDDRTGRQGAGGRWCRTTASSGIHTCTSRRSIQLSAWPAAARSLVAHSDGLETQWDLDALSRASPSLPRGAHRRACSTGSMQRGRDDVHRCVVARPPTR